MSNCCSCKHSVGIGDNLRPRGRQPRIALLRCVALVDAVCTSSTVSAGLETFRVKVVSALFSSCETCCSFALTQVRTFFITFAFKVRAHLRYACPKCSIFLPLGCKHTCMKGESNPAGIASSNRREGSVIHISELAGSSTLHAMPFFLQHQNHFAGPRIKEISLTNSLSLHKIEVWKGHWKTNGP